MTSCGTPRALDDEYPQFDYICENMFKEWDILGAIDRTKHKKIIVMLRRDKTMRNETNILLDAMKNRKLVTKLSDAIGNGSYFIRSGDRVITRKTMETLFGDDYAILIGVEVNERRHTYGG